MDESLSGQAQRPVAGRLKGNGLRYVALGTGRS
jgi:hypothetical protein